MELHAVYTAPEGAIVAPKVVPPPEPTTEQLTCAVDDLDRAIRPASPLVADVLLGIPAPDGTSVSRQDVG